MDKCNSCSYSVSILQLPKINIITSGDNSLVFKDALHWNTESDTIKNASSAAIFK